MATVARLVGHDRGGPVGAAHRDETAHHRRQEREPIRGGPLGQGREVLERGRHVLRILEPTGLLLGSGACRRCESSGVTAAHRLADPRWFPVGRKPPRTRGRAARPPRSDPSRWRSRRRAARWPRGSRRGSQVQHLGVVVGEVDGAVAGRLAEPARGREVFLAPRRAGDLPVRDVADQGVPERVLGLVLHARGRRRAHELAAGGEVDRRPRAARAGRSSAAARPRRRVPRRASRSARVDARAAEGLEETRHGFPVRLEGLGHEVAGRAVRGVPHDGAVHGREGLQARGGVHDVAGHALADLGPPPLGRS